MNASDSVISAVLWAWWLCVHGTVDLLDLTSEWLDLSWLQFICMLTSTLSEWHISKRHNHKKILAGSAAFIVPWRVEGW